MLSLGDAEELSTNASVMLKISILAAWAELQIASVRQAYLKDVIKPYRWLLGPFWIGALRDYAQLRTDPEMGLAGAMDLTGGLGRDVLLPVGRGFDEDEQGIGVLTPSVLRASRAEASACGRHCTFQQRSIRPRRHGRSAVHLAC
jgi:hypothetical protein